ncbi:uncharacterized protein B0I36DRAFT_353615 [Microdochium trichocladiopsis]|uniref:Uncharacterized protein n=1 Tax=Microdochium trichocladiopsis TaxID=1682393 RepID=A0A9P9BK56_9PEZI|nr:uncharacterized protein B0I36DRAFT_353615 [Microdochium trichocladiopsis]KAH7020879.1 hypothetical protein B0I36DRAFT_353615 [Microdochium trichocladiopsis]
MQALEVFQVCEIGIGSRAINLAKEPLLLCFSGIYLKNFVIIDCGQITTVGFQDASYFPLGFQRLGLLGTTGELGYDIMDVIALPSTSSSDNIAALLDAIA